MRFRILDRQTAPLLEAMLDRLTPETPRRWGTMTPAAMVSHCAHAFRLTTDGDPSVRDHSTWFTRAAKPLALWWLPWPRGFRAPTGITVAAPDGCSLDDARGQFRHDMHALLDRLDEQPDHRTRHPWLGWLRPRENRRLHWVHCRHHFRQFAIWNPRITPVTEG